MRTIAARLCPRACMKELRCAINKVRRHGRAGILAVVGRLSLEPITRQSTHIERLRSQPFVAVEAEFGFGNQAARGIEPTLRQGNGTRGFEQDYRGTTRSIMLVADER